MYHLRWEGAFKASQDRSSAGRACVARLSTAANSEWLTSKSSFDCRPRLAFSSCICRKFFFTSSLVSPRPGMLNTRGSRYIQYVIRVSYCLSRVFIHGPPFVFRILAPGVSSSSSPTRPCSGVQCQGPGRTGPVLPVRIGSGPTFSPGSHVERGRGISRAQLLPYAYPRSLVLNGHRFGRIAGPFSSCRDPEAALKCSYRSDILTRDGPVAVIKSERRTEQDSKRALDVVFLVRTKGKPQLDQGNMWQSWYEIRRGTDLLLALALVVRTVGH